MKKLCALLRIKFPARWHQEREFWWRRFDSMAAFLMQCHFQDLHFYLKSHNLRTEDFPLFGSSGRLPRVKCLLLLCKAKPAWIKRSIHYVILQHYNPGELLKEIPPYLPRCCILSGPPCMTRISVFVFGLLYAEEADTEMSSVESQKGLYAVQRCSVEKQKGARSLNKVYVDSALLVVNRTSFNGSVNALLALSRWHIAYVVG